MTRSPRSLSAAALSCFALSLLLALAAVPRPAGAQIVNTLEGFEAEERGWSGALGGSLRGTGGNSEVFDVATDARAQYQNERQRWRALFGYAFTRSDGEDEAEELFVHLRHNRRFAPWLRSLAFAQVQRNPFQRLQSRLLLGAGARFELVRAERARLALGLAHMLEREELEGLDDGSTRQRLSAFLDLGLPLGTNASLSATTFVQPLWEDFSDVRISASLELAARVVGDLSLVSSLEIAHDSEPPPDVEETDWTVRSGLRLAL